MKKLRVALIVVGLLTVAACGSTGSDEADSTTAPSTTVASEDSSTTDPADAEDDSEDTVTDDTEVDDTEVDDTDSTEPEGDFGPAGDEKLIPLLLEPEDFGDDFVYQDPSESEVDNTVCEGVSFSVEWTASATMGAGPESDELFVGVSNSVLGFEDGDAEQFLDEFPGLAQKCEETEEQAGFTLEPLPDVGDQALVAASTQDPNDEDYFPIELVLIRVGDNVSVLFGIGQDEAVLTPDILEMAASNLENG